MARRIGVYTLGTSSGPILLGGVLVLGLLVPLVGEGLNQQRLKQSGTQSATAILYPPNGAVVPSGKVIVIASDCSAPLSIAGSPIAWQYRQGSVSALELELSPGKHVMEIGGARHEVTAVAVPASPPEITQKPNEGQHNPGGDLLRWHPMQPTAESCEACHRPTGGGRWPSVSTPDACFPCHNSIQLEAIHAHPMEHLHHCQDCHHMHAAPKEHLLTKPPKELCRACHDA